MLVSSVSVFASFFFVAIEIPDSCKIGMLICVAAALVVSYAILWALANKASSKKAQH